MFLDTKPIADGTNVNPLGPLGSLGPVVPQNLKELPTTPIQQLKNPITACTKVDTAAEKADAAAQKTDAAAQKTDTAAHTKTIQLAEIYSSFFADCKRLSMQLQNSSKAPLRHL